MEHFAEEKPYLKALPAMPFTVVLTLDRRVTREGMVSVGGNLYSVPDCTRRRVVEVHTLANEIRILEDDQLIAVHPVLEGPRQAPHRGRPSHRAAARQQHHGTRDATARGFGVGAHRAALAGLL